MTFAQSDALRIPLPDKSVHCCISSPPYWGLRDYGLDEQGIGLEATPDEYIANMVAVGREIWRVLRDDGTFFLNMGDSYANAQPRGHFGDQGQTSTGAHGEKVPARAWSCWNLKQKDLVGMPWRVAFALQADGWYLRSDIIWSKPNPMPESVTDRPTKAHEYVFLLAKRARYFYDADAVKEQSQSDHPSGNGYKREERLSYRDKNGARGSDEQWQLQPTRNRRTVWTIATQPYSGAHFATFPEKLVEPMIKAGTSEHGVCPECGAGWKRVVERGKLRDISGDHTTQLGSTKGSKFQGKAYTDGGWMVDKGLKAGWAYEKKTVGWVPTCTHDHNPIPATVLDPFCGSGTAGVVARRLGRRFIGLDLSAEYLQLARQRLGLTALDDWNARRARVVTDDMDGLPLFDKEVE